MTITPEALIAAAQTSKAWPFQEAQRLAKRLPEGKPGGVLFETGYGPSGLPHIGTFQEVLRTTLVRRAYEALTGGAATRLVAFSDDLDGLRKVPDNVPNQAMLTQHLGKPLSRIPDPFDKFESFAAHNNAMLRDFLDRFGFEYEFVSSSDCYNGGKFDAALKGVLANFSAILDIMLPTLGEERRKTYSPIMPISPATGVSGATSSSARRSTCRRCRPPRSARSRRPATSASPAPARPWRRLWARLPAETLDLAMMGRCRSRDPDVCGVLTQGECRPAAYLNERLNSPTKEFLAYVHAPPRSPNASPWRSRRRRAAGPAGSAPRLGANRIGGTAGGSSDADGTEHRPDRRTHALHRGRPHRPCGDHQRRSAGAAATP
jgi:hypothetical protein